MRKIYRITPHYRSLIVYKGKVKTGELVGTTTYTPDKDLSKPHRFAVICDFLRSERLPVPKFKP